MTAQIPDTFIYRDEEFDLIGKTDGELFDPEAHGLKPRAMHSACWRGFYATYRLDDDALRLVELSIFTGDDGYPPLDGVEVTETDDGMVYRGLRMIVPFTGKIRLATDFLQEHYVHMGFQKATAYKTVIDITLDRGRVAEVKDRSAEVATRRGSFQDDYHSRHDRMGAIEDAFSLDLDLE